ncbi:MAG: hypothetical protein AAF590_01015 [Pseudomonadota bacterium]
MGIAKRLSIETVFGKTLVGEGGHTNLLAHCVGQPVEASDTS